MLDTVAGSLFDAKFVYQLLGAPECDDAVAGLVFCEVPELALQFVSGVGVGLPTLACLASPASFSLSVATWVMVAELSLYGYWLL
jgi:hypothetical protein